MSKIQLGEFEEIVLLTVGILHGNAYGITIKEEIENRMNREVSVGALQVTNGFCLGTFFSYSGPES
jgi:hypothetical protein